MPELPSAASCVRLAVCVSLLEPYEMAIWRECSFFSTLGTCVPQATRLAQKRKLEARDDNSEEPRALRGTKPA